MRQPAARMFLMIAGVCALGGPARAVTYQTTILHPLAGFDFTFAQGTSGTIQVGYGSDAITHGQRALLWQGSPESVINLNPTNLALLGTWQSQALSAAGNVQVGYGYTNSNSNPHALLWTGTAASAVDLNPFGALGESQARAVWGDYQVGWADSEIGLSNATLWHGAAASAINLHPAGFVYSSANGLSGDTQVGSGLKPGEDVHALLWHGSAASAVDLNPANFTFSVAADVSGSSQVGYGSGAATGGNSSLHHALLWNGTAASAVDLNPAGFYRSTAEGIAGNLQVGGGNETASGQMHALLWRGTAESAVDLHQYLAGLPIVFEQSYASDIDASGTIVGFARDSAHAYAVIWTPVPEPPTWLSIVIGSALLSFAIAANRGSLVQSTVPDSTHDSPLPTPHAPQRIALATAYPASPPPSKILVPR